MKVGAWSNPFLLSWTAREKNRVIATNDIAEPSLPSRWQRDRQTKFLHVSFNTKGEGFLEAYLYEYDAFGALSVRRVWDGILKRSADNPRRVKLNLILRPDTQTVRIVLQNGGLNAGAALATLEEACFVSYEDDIPQKNYKEKESMTKSQILAWVTRTQKEKTERQLVREWRYHGMVSLEQENNKGAVLLREDCHMFDWRCPVLQQNRWEFRHFVQKDSDGIYITNASGGNTRIEWLSGSVQLGLPTLLEVAISSRLWAFNRSPERHNPLLSSIANQLESSLPNAPPKHLKLHSLEMKLSTLEGSVIAPTIYWKDEKGRQHGFYLGPQTIRVEKTQYRWLFPLPVDAKDVQTGIFAENEDMAHLKLERIRLFEHVY